MVLWKCRKYFPSTLFLKTCLILRNIFSYQCFCPVTSTRIFPAPFLLHHFSQPKINIELIQEWNFVKIKMESVKIREQSRYAAFKISRIYNLNPAIRFRDIFGHPQITFLSNIETISFSHIGWHFCQILWWWSVWRVMIIFSRAIARKAHAAGAQMSFGLKADWLSQNSPYFLMNRCFCSFPLDFDCMI